LQRPLGQGLPVRKGAATGGSAPSGLWARRLSMASSSGSPPTQPSLISPTGTAGSPSVVPTTHVPLAASSTDTDPIYYDFQVASDSGFANVLIDSGALPQTDVFTPPAGLLRHGSTYDWRVP